MAQQDQLLITRMGELKAAASSLTTDSLDALFEFSLMLEASIRDMPPDMEMLTRLLERSSDVLHALHQQPNGDDHQLSDWAVRFALVAEQYAMGVEDREEQVAQLNQELTETLEALDQHEGGETNPVGPDDEPEELLGLALDLNDLAALFMQLEPEDTMNLARVRQTLQETTIGASAGLQSILTEAIGKLSAILDGTSNENAELFDEIGQLIEEALDAADQEGMPDFGVSVADVSGTSAEVITLPADADAELVGDFITECHELVAEAEAALLALETDPHDAEAINTVFRAFHTVKGTSAFVGFETISTLSHHAESLLSRVRDQEILCTGGYADLALRSTDMLKELIQCVEVAVSGQVATQPSHYHELIQVLSAPEEHGVSTGLEPEQEQVPRVGDILVAQGTIDRDEAEDAAAQISEQPIGVAIVQTGAASVTQVAQALRTQERIRDTGNRAESSVRVRTDRLDRLIDVVGELVIAHSMVAQDETIMRAYSRDLTRKVAHTGKIVRELQDLSMAMRMIPLRSTFQKMARLVRDVARKRDKEVRFVTSGEDTEIDRNMVDVISDPLIHMVRNAVDHGIEAPADRQQAGKPSQGTIRLSAYHSGGSVIVEIQDDGKGLQRNRIVEKAIAKGLIESDKGLSDSEVYSLIFQPGFSTAEQVTEVSGRGVGLDVVRRNIETLRGRIDTASQPGQGSTFTLRVPLTLAITDGMLVKVGNQRYIVPTISIQVTIRPEAEELATLTGRGEMLRLRGELVPIFRLHHLFGVEDATEKLTDALLVVIDDGSRRCALVVDELLAQQQVVAKPLKLGISKVPGISGAAILGDGQVGLILDPLELVALARQA